VRIEFSLLTASDLQRVTASLQSGTIENADEFDADPFLAANPQRIERIILLSAGDVQQDRFEKAVPSAVDELALRGALP
jgi:hypothetical protein